jgi:hypothetical protein
MDTPMAVSGIATAVGSSTDAVREARNACVPLRGKMGSPGNTALQRTPWAALALATLTVKL